MTDDERNAKTAHLTILIQEEERKREAYRVSSDLFCFDIEVWWFISILKLQIENMRRRHNWLPFIVELVKAYAEQGVLVSSVDKVRWIFVEQT